MTSDLIFSVLPREGTVPIAKDELRVKKVEKEAELRALNDEEKELNAEERDAREKYHQKSSKDEDANSSSDQKPNQKTEQKQNTKQPTKGEEAADPELPSVDEQGRKHLDIYI